MTKSGMSGEAPGNVGTPREASAGVGTRRETIKVRIAVSVGTDENGKPSYMGYGYSGCGTWDDTLGDFEALEKERRYWVTAEIPIEEDKEFSGVVEAENP